jgi:hypothetical protein
MVYYTIFHKCPPSEYRVATHRPQVLGRLAGRQWISSVASRKCKDNTLKNQKPLCLQTYNAVK